MALSWLILCAAVALFFLVKTVYGAATLPSVRHAPKLETTKPPLVSILVPARNEGHRVLRQCLEALVAQTYPAIEIIATDDESTDNTLEIMREVEAASGGRLKAFVNTVHRAGWLGKLSALESARQHATGEWLLCADADVVYDPTTVECMMRSALHERLDALTLVPRVATPRFWPSGMLPVFAWMSVVAVSPAQANNPRSPQCFGFGGCLLVRREAHEAIGGFESYKNKILDDWAVMTLMKREGYRVRVALGIEFIETQMYATVRETFHGYGKNAFVGLNYNYLLLVGAIVIDNLAFAVPLVYGLFGLVAQRPPDPWAWLAVSLSFLTMLIYGLRTRANPRFYFLYPVGHLLVQALIVYSACLYTWGKGGQWKGRSLERDQTKGPGDA